MSSLYSVFANILWLLRVVIDLLQGKTSVAAFWWALSHGICKILVVLDKCFLLGPDFKYRRMIVVCFYTMIFVSRKPLFYKLYLMKPSVKLNLEILSDECQMKLYAIIFHTQLTEWYLEHRSYFQFQFIG